MHNIASERGGECLSQLYVNYQTKLKWRCSDNHIWEAMPSKIIFGQWCKICGQKKRGINSRKTIESANQLALERGGVCLSENYQNAITRLRWRCSEGHEWEINYNKVQQGTWCPFCAGNKTQTIEDMKLLARDRGGECMSLKYENTGSKLLWRCGNGHEWFAVPDSIKRGTWCPHCSGSYGERLCRFIMESIFNTKFPKSRPDWLIGSKGNLLEYDGYSQELNLAFEYHGQQHYREVSHFHKRRRSFEDQKIDDNEKLVSSEIRNVKVVVFPYFQEGISLVDAINLIINNLKNSGLDIPLRFEINSELLNSWNSGFELNECKEIAIKKGGECLSEVYFGVFKKLKWKCGLCGTIWDARPHDINRGKWCPKCGYVKRGDSRRGSIQDIITIAELQGGKCLSKEYKNAYTKLEFECKKGHTWFAVPRHIVKGVWCPKCGFEKNGLKKRNKLSELKKLAESKGGNCLSTEYVPMRSKALWQCSEGHIWEATPAHVKNGTWCKQCHRLRFRKS